MRYAIQKKFFGKYDDYLDRAAYGPTWLAQDNIAHIVAESLHHLDGKRYTLMCYCIMPNHVHVVFELLEKPVSHLHTFRDRLVPVLHSIKSRTACESNKLLSRSGPFWQHESYDHIVRDGAEFERIVYYARRNPVEAGLVDEWRKWKWIFIRSDLSDLFFPTKSPSRIECSNSQRRQLPEFSCGCLRVRTLAEAERATGRNLLVVFSRLSFIVFPFSFGLQSLPAIENPAIIHTVRQKFLDDGSTTFALKAARSGDACFAFSSFCKMTMRSLRPKAILALSFGFLGEKIRRNDLHLRDFFCFTLP